MNEDSNQESNEQVGGIVKQTIDSATALAKAVPIYEDAIQPLAKETGKALGTLGKAVNVALAPISLVVWGYDQIKEFLETRVTEKLENVPEDRITTPPTNIVGPAVEALKFTGQDPTLQDMFANLIANSLDSKTVLEAHPSFVDMIKNLSPDEGLILKLFASTQNFPMVDVRLNNKNDSSFNVLHRNVSQVGVLSNCKHPQLTANYLDNLCRLGILEIPSGQRINDPKAYEILTSDPSLEQLKNQIDGNEEFFIGFEQKFIQATGWGRQFINACIIDKRVKG
ncbi:hypothetical protein MGMO_61c00220 [Methyloglobulus morosus KoM1]|uniref:DUF4393 domain-containing protein n=1 Tax=Methyloglobulus morosus KoM1 TaxID=1116472 RepID=V5DYA6_9GAMM|nr:DUF4393 domain-containing protein [Methyloglobulus morosus]ESS72311.1 hypothetical protein MGMO_61c00220 [Methyloglobulus morosus KoM1]